MNIFGPSTVSMVNVVCLGGWVCLSMFRLMARRFSEAVALVSAWFLCSLNLGWSWPCMALCWVYLL